MMSNFVHCLSSVNELFNFKKTVHFRSPGFQNAEQDDLSLVDGNPKDGFSGDEFNIHNVRHRYLMYVTQLLQRTDTFLGFFYIR